MKRALIALLLLISLQINSAAWADTLEVKWRDTVGDIAYELGVSSKLLCRINEDLFKQKGNYDLIVVGQVLRIPEGYTKDRLRKGRVIHKSQEQNVQKKEQVFQNLPDILWINMQNGVTVPDILHEFQFKLSTADDRKATSKKAISIGEGVESVKKEINEKQQIQIDQSNTALINENARGGCMASMRNFFTYYCMEKSVENFFAKIRELSFEQQCEFVIFLLFVVLIICKILFIAVEQHYYFLRQLNVIRKKRKKAVIGRARSDGLLYIVSTDGQFSYCSQERNADMALRELSQFLIEANCSLSEVRRDLDFDVSLFDHHLYPLTKAQISFFMRTFFVKKVQKYFSVKYGEVFFGKSAN